MDSKVIGARLTELRGKRSQTEVANACDISLSAVDMYERGERIPRDKIKIKLARFFKVKVEDIFYA